MIVVSYSERRQIADMPSTAKGVAIRLRALRESLGMKQADLCRATGFSSAQWAQYETGVRRISVDAALVLRRHFGVTLDYIFAGDRSGLPLRIAGKLPSSDDDTDENSVP